MNADPVWGFYYGGLINPGVMQKLGMSPTKREVALVRGFELTIAPLMNLVRNEQQVAYGLLMLLGHDEIEQAYSKLKAKYYPYPIVAEDLDGKSRPALCYLLPAMAPEQADADYVTNLLDPATELSFPEWYLEHIRSFLPR